MPLRLFAHLYVRSIIDESSRRTHSPSGPGAPCATTVTRWIAGITGVFGSAAFHAATVWSHIASICASGYSPMTPIFLECGLP